MENKGKEERKMKENRKKGRGSPCGFQAEFEGEQGEERKENEKK
jgi:hypothetical protein